MEYREKHNLAAVVDAVLNDAELKVAILMAHPDDEAVCLGGHLTRLRHADFIYATDGAPRHLKDANAAGFATREGYLSARAAERRAAFQLAGIPEGRIRELGFVDQDCAECLVDLTQSLAEYFRLNVPDAVITHPYEGGHPDHDACAFAARHACDLMPSDRRPALLEAATYHGVTGAIRAGEFLPASCEVVRVRLDAEALALKKSVFSCYPSQERTLRHVFADAECIRYAPRYDFREPPHEGRLLYEQFGFGITGAIWREAAAAAEKSLRAAPHESVQQSVPEPQ